MAENSRDALGTERPVGFPVDPLLGCEGLVAACAAHARGVEVVAKRGEMVLLDLAMARVARRHAQVTHGQMVERQVLVLSLDKLRTPSAGEASGVEAHAGTRAWLLRGRALSVGTRARLLRSDRQRQVAAKAGFLFHKGGGVGRQSERDRERERERARG